MAKYEVMREHHGDRLFQKGEEREADPADVAHLVERGVLAEASAKAAEATQNKAAPKAKNKAAK